MPFAEFDATAAVTKEARQKALHHEIAKEHFRRAANLAPQGTKTSHNALEGHFAVHSAGHRSGISPRTIAGAKKKAFEHVGAVGQKILDKHPRGNSSESSRRADSAAAREHLKLGQHHANAAGFNGVNSRIPSQGYSW